MRFSTRTNPFRPNSQALALEPRILFDGAAAVAVDHQQNHDSDSQAATTEHPATSEPATAASRDTSPSKHLLVLDSRIENREQLLAGLPSDVTALVVNTNENGLAAISAALAQMGQVDSVQILSHGSSGQFTLGNQMLTASNIEQFSETLQGWKPHLSAGADIQLYGCDVGAGSAGQTLVNELAQLTGADVGASNNDTGASSKGGDWNLEVRAGDVDKHLALGAVALSSFDGLLANSAPTVTAASAGSDVLLGDQFTFTLNFANASSALGYAPFVTVFMPATGKDGNDGATFVSASYLGTTLSSDVVVFDSAGNATSPVAVGSDGKPLVINASTYGMRPGDQMVVIRIPFASVSQDQPVMPIVITANLSNLADTSFSNGSPDLTIKAVGGFELGDDALNNPTSDPSIIQGTAASFVVHPTVITFSENISTPEGETASGPNFPRTLTTTVTPAPGQTLSNVLVTQPLPDNIQVTSIIPSAGGTLVSLTLADGTVLTNPTAIAAAIAADDIFISEFTVQYASLTGPADTAVNFYVPETDANGNVILDPYTGNDATINLAPSTAAGEWVPLDPRDVVAPATTIDFTGTGSANSFLVKSITLIKESAIQTDLGTTGVTPGDTLLFTLKIDVSDYFAFGQDLFGEGQFVVNDQMSDGLTLTNTPTLTLTLNGATQTIALITQVITHADGSSTAHFDVAASVKAAYQVRSWINGDLAFDDVLQGATHAVINYTAQVGQSYTPPAGSPHSEINEGDAVGNNAQVTASVLLDRFNISGFDQTDGSSSTSTVPVSHVEIGVVSVNGSASGAGAELRPGDTVTFSISYDLVTGDYQNFSLTAYLPEPLFDVSSIVWGTGNNAGQWSVGAGNTNAGGVLSVTSGAANSIVFDLGSHVSSATVGSRVELQFTIQVGNQPFADQRQEVVLAQSTQQTTLTNVTLESEALVTIISVAEPLLAIAHGVVSASNGTVTGTTGSWRAPGTSGAPFSGSVTSLAAIEGKAAGLDGSDVLRLATAIENTGGGGAFDVSTSITLPTGLSFVGGSLANANLQIFRGDGSQLVAGVDYSVSGSQITFLDSGGQATLLAGRAGTANDTSGRNLVVITYDTTVAATINAGRTLQSTATLTNYASTEGGPDFTPTDLTDTADQQIAAPVVRIVYANGTLDASDSSAAHTSGADLVIGESMLYDIVVTLPEGSTQNLRVDDQIPDGLRLDTTFNGGLGYQLITTTAGSGALTSDFAGSVAISGTVSPAGSLGADGFDIRHNFSASAATADNATGNNSFVIRLRLIASNVIANQATRAVQNSAQLIYSDPDGNTPNGSSALDRTVTRTGSALTTTVREPTLQITQVLTSTSDPGGYDDGDPLAFTLTISNGNTATDFAAFDLILRDTLPIELSNVTLVGVTYQGSATNNGGGDFEIVGGQLRSVSGANIDIGKGGSIVLRLSGVVNSNAAADGPSFNNVATVEWTSLDGTNSGERTGVDGPLQGGTLNDYQRSSVLVVPVPAALELSRVGGLPDTPAANPTTTVVEQVTIGEIVRYRANAIMPEGVNANYVLTFTLDNGLDLLTDSIRIVFISNNGMTSNLTLITGGSLNVVGDQTSAIAQPITPDLSGASPTGVLDPARVQVTTVNGQQVVSLSLGSISNINDNDANLEGLTVDFSVRVLNQASNVAGVALGVSAQGSVNGVQRTASGTLYEQVVEPNFSGLDKHVISFNPNPTGSTGTATVQISMTQDGNLAAYDTHLADGFTGGSNYSLLSLTINGSTYGPGNLPAGVSVTTSGGIALDFVKLDAGAQVKVVYQVTLPNAAAIASTDATLTWSSLPETFTSWGGSTVGTDGTADGERTGSNVGPNTYIRTEGAGLGVVAGTLWNDSASATSSATPDGPGLAGQTVNLTWAGVDGDLGTSADNLQFSAVTDSNGQYHFGILASGLYRIDTPTGTISYPEPLGTLKVRIDSDTGTPLGRIELTLGEGSTAAANAGYVEQNAAPINTLPGTQTTLEDIPLAIGGISISDVDADRDPNAASRELTVTLSVLHGGLTLSANPQGAAIAGSGTGTLVLTGTQAQLNAALANLRYQGNLNYNGTDTLTVLTNDQGNFGDFDGDGIPGEVVEDARTDTDSLLINITPVNDAPQANPDTANALEAGGEQNRTPGVNPRGNLLSNDTDVDIATNQDQLRIISAGLTAGTQAAVPSTGNRIVVGAYGGLILTSTGTYEYRVNNTDPAVEALRLSGQTLTDTFTYTISDLAGVQSTSTFTVTIGGANDTPVGNNDSGTATEAGGVLNGTPGSNATGNVLTNDTDVDSVANGETKTVTGARSGREIDLLPFTTVPGSGTLSVTGTFGTLTINAAGTYTYVIDNTNTAVQQLVPGTTLTEYFTYRLTDTGNLDDSAQLTITINGAYDNPVASDDAATAQAAATNDSSLESNPTGNVILFPSRPGPTDNGIDSDVDAPDRPNTNLQVNGVINKPEAAYNPGVDTLTTVTSGGTLATGQYGALTIRADGSFTYDVDSANAAVIALAPNQTLTEIFTYQVVDTAGKTDTAQLVITVHGVNDPPEAQSVFSNAVEAGGVHNGTPGINPSGDATRNDFDPDGDPLLVTDARSGPATGGGINTPVTAGGTAIIGTFGTLTLRANGTYTYVLDNANGAVEALRQPGDLLLDRFTYTVSDGSGGSDQAEIVIIISGRNDTPVAGDDTASATEAGGVGNGTPGIDPTGNVLTNDHDPDGGETPGDQAYGETRQVASVRTGTELGSGTAGSLGTDLRGTYGWLQLNADGSYTYRVDNSLSAVQALRGTANTLLENFSYTVVDADGAQDRATLTVTIHGANDAPVAVNDTASAIEAGGLNNGTPGSNPTGNVLTNDFDVDRFGETLSVVGVGHGVVSGTIGSALAGSYGSLQLNADGSYSYVVDNSNAAVQALRTNPNTLTDSFTYRITDLAGATSTATLFVTIHGRNDNPHATDDIGTAVEAGGTFNNAPGSNATGNVHDNDVDVDANDSRTLDGIRTGTEGANGALQTVSGSATITGVYGQLQINADGTYTYTVNNSLATVQALKPGESLVEHFTYRTHDLAGASDLAQLTLTIQGAWDAPVANDDQAYAVAQSPTSAGYIPNGNVLPNDRDVDANDSKTVTGIRTGTEAAGGALTSIGAGITITGLYGQLEIYADGSYSYVVDSTNPAIIVLGPLGTVREHFTYEMADGGGLTDTAQLNILIRGGDQPPVAVDDSNVAIDQKPAPHAQGNVLPNDFDIDLSELLNEQLHVTAIRTGEELGTGVDGALSQVIQGRYGKLVLNADGSYSYTIDLNNRDVLAAAGMGQVLKDVFTYTVSDFWGASDQAQLTISLDIAAPYVPIPDHSDALYYPLGDEHDPHTGYPLPGVDPIVFIGPVVEREGGISELATWKADGSNIDLVKTAEIGSDTLNQTLRPLAGQYVQAAVRQSSANSQLDLAWVLGRSGRINLSADGLLSDPSVFAPLPADMLPRNAEPQHRSDQHPDNSHTPHKQENLPASEQQTLQQQLPSPLPPTAASPSENLSARGFSAQLQAAAHRLPPRGAAGARPL
jgi:VCBS repeat-containing protein